MKIFSLSPICRQYLYVLPRLFVFIFLVIACRREESTPASQAIPCNAYSLNYRQIDSQHYRIEGPEFIEDVRDHDSLILLKKYALGEISPYQSIYYYRKGGQAHRVLDSLSTGDGEFTIRESTVQFYKDSIVQNIQERYTNSSSVYDLGRDVFFLDSLGMPITKARLGEFSYPVGIQYTFGSDLHRGIVFKEWSFLGIPAPYYPVKTTRFGGPPPEDGEGYETYSYQYRSDGRLDAYREDRYDFEDQIIFSICWDIQSF